MGTNFPIRSTAKMLTRNLVFPSNLLKLTRLSAHKAVVTSNLSSSTETYTERQAKLGRPLSPHVTIYKFPIVATSSIIVRATGVALSAGVMGIGALALGGVDVAALMSSVGTSVVGPAAKFVVAYPFIYHYLGGIRHFVWDKNPDKLLFNDQVEKTAYAILAASVATSGVCAFVSI